VNPLMSLLMVQFGNNWPALATYYQLADYIKYAQLLMDFSYFEQFSLLILKDDFLFIHRHFT